jgi:hypothetical protein
VKRPNHFVLVTVFALASFASASWKEKVLYSFQGTPDGSSPAGVMVLDKQGNLYGATTAGGSTTCRGPFQCGTVFQLKAPAKKGDAWKETLLYVFKGTDSNDGASPSGGVVWDQAGNLYGATGYDGTGNCILFGARVGCGTVYQLKPPTVPGGAWTESVIYNFRGGNDGQLPLGDLVFDAAGNLYGATEYGGGFGSCNAPFYQYCGTVFRLSPPKKKGGKWTEKVLHSFKSGSDGANPNGGLTFDGQGAIYGTTYIGGNQGCDSTSGTGCGTVFRLKPPVTKTGAWTEKVLLRFKADTRMGANPTAGVTFGTNGALYGTTSNGGKGYQPVGTIFRLDPPVKSDDPWTETLIHTFGNGSNGGWTPVAGVIFDGSGNLYGAAAGGGFAFDGTLFELHALNNWAYKVLYNFAGPPDGELPSANLIFDGKGNLYGTTQIGGTGQSCQGGCGAVYEVSP